MIESPKNFIEQFQNFIEHIAGVMNGLVSSKKAQTFSDAEKKQARDNIGASRITDATASSSTLEAGNVATAQLSMDNETGKLTFTFGIPKGDKGDTGARGPQGIQGIQGPQGPQGPRGPAGASWINFYGVGAITSGYCTYPTIVNVMCTSGNITINLNGQTIYPTGGYHSQYREGVCFCCPAGATWSMTGANISHVTYAEWRM
mgnify:CR=1 FL=1